MVEHKVYTVDLIVTSEHRYEVPARTIEEAVSTAEDLLDSGDEGVLINSTVETADAVCGESLAEDFFEEEILEP